MNLSNLTSVTTAAEMQTWLAQNCLTPIRPTITGSNLGTILQKIISVQFSNGQDPVWDAEKGNYYTKNEADTLLAGKAAASHSHIIANVTGLQAALDAKQAELTYTPE